ncbi:lipopolysaccharide biosynthesis protein [Rhizobiales bacterium RZME27]|uniref:Lipopolysaccharide biosynthesis protein n=1 Tax=Endobacterium cereale TaxID=2663029 RepID=A0A6A8A727_9HYPH|nr:oligosaccharide flippase family protein [Endobacterium cereale]MEB2844609.1 oligosaccharide flippase family protein [Endobacterium cereale]MQY45076.1 lipopolysaccharide biosynthesis protein [Endobacterium cereale]
MLLRSTLIYGPAILLTRLSALLFLVLATRIVDPAEYGLLTLVVTVGEMTDTAFANWLRVSLLRLGGKGEIASGSLVRAGRMVLATTAIGLVVSVAASAAIVPERWGEFSIAVCTYLLASAIARYALTVLQMQQRHTAYSFLEFLRAVLQLALPAATMLVEHNSFLAISIASSLGMLVTGVIANIIAWRQVIKGPPKFTQREFLALGLPIIAIAVVGFGLTNAERVMLKLYQNAGAVAIFASAYALARQPVDMIANAINMGAFPETVSRFDEKGPAAAGTFLSQFMGLTFTLALPVVAMLSAIGSDLAALVLPKAYIGPYTLLFTTIAIGAFLTNLADFVYGSMVHAHKRPLLFIISKLFGTAANIGLAMLLIPSMAEAGAAFSLMGAAAINLVISAVISERLTPIALPWRAIGAAALVSACVWGTAYGAKTLAGDAPVLVRLMVAGTAGGAVFLVLNAALNPQAARQVFTKAKAMIGRRTAIG